MFGRLLPKEGRFFDLFVEHADEALAASRELSELMGSVDNIERRAFVIETHEKRGDKITQQTIALLHTTFITPLDRDDIHLLITRMDDILDLIEDCAQSIYLYDVRFVTPETKKLAEICVACIEQVRAAVSMLSNMDNGPRILQVCEEIDRLESEADHVMRAAMAKLFREEQDARELIKHKEVYELLESITDKCEAIANIIESIVV